MEQRAFGFTGIKLPVVGQGTWQMEGDDEAACLDAIRRGIDAGMTHIDTAEMYGSGAVESLVGKAIEGRRDEVFLASKVLPNNASYSGTIAACERSLKRLRTDRLDLYLLHWPGAHPLEETIRAFKDLRDQGKIRYFGVSNFDQAELSKAIAIAGPNEIACNQVLYHLLERAIEHRVVPLCERHGIAVVAYSPFGSGRFPEPNSTAGKVLASIAAARGATPRQVALRFLLRRQPTFVIPKAASAAHALDNAAAGDLRLTSEDLARIETAFPLGRDRGVLPTL
ncbi:aldo/keto reductase [Sorangium sp. So ce1099]|uniref:aldo/keto reductase n=1 Tax=Sorangium sp. So ce1099 TaxID=3133331 RepID=UPI003F601830